MIVRGITSTKTLDSDDAADYVSEPTAGDVEAPFQLSKSQPSSKTSTPAKAAKPSGRKIAHKQSIEKYGFKGIPDPIKSLLRTAARNSGLDRNGKKLLPRILAASKSRATWRKYSSVIRIYNSFCANSDGNFGWPATESALNAFAIWCAVTKRLTAKTIDSYLAALAAAHHISYSPFPWPKSRNTENIVLGISNRNLGRKPKKKPEPFSFRVLAETRIRIAAKKWPALNKIVLWTACVVGYFGACRAGELFATCKNSFDKYSDLLWSDIELTNKSAIITVKAPKTRKPRPQQIRLFRVAKQFFCPVNCLNTLKSAQEIEGIFEESGPVFRFKSGSALTVAKFTKTIRKLLRHSPFRSAKISARSLRSGLPSDMETDPDYFTDAHIKCWGRWRSRAYESYLRNDDFQKEWLFHRISESLLNRFNV